MGEAFICDAVRTPVGRYGAAQDLATLRQLVATAAYQLRRTSGRYALCTLCIGVGQGMAMILEQV